MDQDNQRDITFSKLFQWTKKEWKLVSYLCHGCGKPFKTIRAKELHPDKCLRVNRLYKPKRK